VATAAILGAVPPYLIENVRPLAVPYQGNKVDRPQASFEAHLATLRPCYPPCVISEGRRPPALTRPAVTQGSPLAILPLDSGPGQSPHPKTTP
jgi:hypothetical protein